MKCNVYSDGRKHLARLTRRALNDEDPKVREMALDPIELGIELLSAPLPAAAKADDLPDNLKKAREEVKQLRKQAERADKERAAMKDQLTAARGDIAAREKSLAEVRDELTQARAELARSSALEGLPGYSRIRVATDVRLIYRRGEGNTLEILSLIDREDLDRYIRQARTR